MAASKVNANVNASLQGTLDKHAKQLRVNISSVISTSEDGNSDGKTCTSPPPTSDRWPHSSVDLSDTEDSIVSSCSGGPKLSRQQGKNKKKRRKKKNDNRSPPIKENQSLSMDFLKPTNVNVQPPMKKDTPARSQLSIELEVHALLLPLCLSVQKRILNGFPYETQYGRFVYNAVGMSCLEAVLGEQRLVPAEVRDMESSSSCIDANFMGESEALSSSPSPPPTMNRTDNVQKCSRCRQYFDVAFNGSTSGSTICMYHSKKAILTQDGTMRYGCCLLSKQHSGCQAAQFHVYHHLTAGVNGPLADFVPTEESVPSRKPHVFGLDCEMVFTTLGFEVARATLVDLRGVSVVDLWVLPIGEVLDYNTAFSGVTETHMQNAITFKEAQIRLMSCIFSCDVLVGHSLHSDLAVLKMLHRRVVDTSLLFPVDDMSASAIRLGSPIPLPRRQGLKTLVKQHLGEDIQTTAKGHSSMEDATAALNLALATVRIPPLPKPRNAFHGVHKAVTVAPQYLQVKAA